MKRARTRQLLRTALGLLRFIFRQKHCDLHAHPSLRAWKQVLYLSLLTVILAGTVFAQGTPNIAWQGAHTNFANAVAFSPDGGLVASGSSDHTTKIWRASDGVLLRTLTQCSGVGCRGVSAVAFSPNGQIIAAAGRSLDMWNAADGTLIRRLNGTRSALAFSPDGQLIAAAGSGLGDYRYDDTISFYRVSDGVKTRTMTRTGSVSSLVFTEGGQTLVSGSSDPNEDPVYGFQDSRGCPANGTWYILRSTNGAMMSLAWGTSDDAPQPGDFDGDGRTDIAVWRSSNGTWYVVKSSDGNLIELRWGNDGDVPVASRYLIQ